MLVPAGYYAERHCRGQPLRAWHLGGLSMAPINSPFASPTGVAAVAAWIKDASRALSTAAPVRSEACTRKTRSGAFMMIGDSPRRKKDVLRGGQRKREGLQSNRVCA